MNVPDQMWLARVGVLCASTPSLTELESVHGGRPNAGSVHAADLATVKGSEVERVVWVSLLARLWTDAAEENLRGLAALFNTPVLNHPPRPLLRAVLEHTARGWWVISAESTEARCARAWLARWVGVLEEEQIANRDGGATGAMATAAMRRRALEQKILELFGEAPKRAKRPFEHSLITEQYGSFTSLVGDVISETLQGAPAAAMYPTLSVLMHSTASAVLAFAESDDKSITIGPWEPSFLLGATLTVLAVWRGSLLRVLDHHGWSHPGFSEWSDALDATITAHNDRQRR